MAGQLSLRKQAIKNVVYDLEFAKFNNYPEGWIEARLVELRHQVKMFKQVASNSLHEHQKEFGANFMSDPTPKDLMEMGY